MLPRRGFILKPIERPPFKRSACFCLEITGDFKRSEYFNFETSFMEN